MAQRIRFYVDEHIPKAVAHGLRQRGVDVATVAALDRGTSDEAHLDRSLTDKRVFVTADADFLRFHAQGRPHAGIVFVTYGASVGALIRRLALIAQVLDAEDMQNQVEFV